MTPKFKRFKFKAKMTKDVRRACKYTLVNKEFMGV